MSVMIDEAQVHHIAKLSRLHLTNSEARLFAGQLAGVVRYVRQIEAVNTEGVEPLAHPLPITNVLRDDVPEPSLTSAQVLSNAPARAGELFRVPAVLDPLGGGF